MRFAARTHPGRRGGQNEDSLGWDEASGLYFVADGMGGHASGDVASRIVKETLLGSALQLPLRAAVRRAHEEVAQAAADNTAHANMGSTVVAARIEDRHAEVAWVGDSRAYLWRGNVLRQLTRDHSYLEVLREQENLSETQLRGHPNKNLVTQTLGIGTPEPSLINEPLRKGDWLLLCSDGLNDELEDGEIAQILRTNAAPDAAADALIAAALARGGRDNVSAVVVEYDGPNGVSFDQKTILWLAVLGGAFAAILLAVLWWWLYGR
ncbi:MAG TPA: protein phosphatase 2C domain-containing protein [Steroidobacteraceae bacterium]|jgi:protein phosphatase|nr:protein phosphatase 2C domain-containing protein [Steroidobacteraceae bacterium]